MRTDTMPSVKPAPKIEDDQILALSAEAWEAGDIAQVRICDSALSGNKSARTKCARVIADAAAQQDK